MPINLKNALGGNSTKPIGSTTYFVPHPYNPIVDVIDSGNATWLRSGSVLQNVALTYPDAYNNFKAPDLKNWNISKINPVPALKLFIAGTTGKYIAIGANTLLSSTDSINWTQQTFPPLSGEPYVIEYGAGIFLVGTSTGFIYTSTDGVTWTSRTITNGSSIREIKRVPNCFVATSEQGIVITSVDGISWTTRYSNSSYQFGSIAFLGNLVVVGGANIVIRSLDGGTTWQPSAGANAVPFYYNTLAAGNGIFVSINALGNTTSYYTSTDGLTWTLSTQAAKGVVKMIFAKGFFIIASKINTFYTSTDGINWTLLNISPTETTNSDVSTIYYDQANDKVMTYSSDTRSFYYSLNNSLGTKSKKTLGNAVQYMRIK